MWEAAWELTASRPALPSWLLERALERSSLLPSPRRLEVLPVLAYQETRSGLTGVKSAAELTPTAWMRLSTAPVQ